ncbi:response regulator [Rhodoplanes sp. Z2-YC6860]|uniref:response regulator n=1 Tax=Rhodoplanes sp. Z2-YC6860 TaxID=674703 RepID=UPI00078D7DE1|nr:response regulator [Rhodoplanes sp. Z2-YC6860]AMN42285.1 PAS/PAC sensor hybrid histidine kinase [Rhodoplanes sp. Z2-YC6860]
MSSETAPLPRHNSQALRPAAKPRLAFARDDATGSAMQPEAPARILIVEDDFLVASDVEAALLDAGFDVVGVAETADTAIALARSQKPALILMDIRLVGPRDGIDTAIAIYRDQGIRSLFASAHSDALARSRAAPAEPLGWLQKPYSMGRLVDAVKEALAGLSNAP